MPRTTAAPSDRRRTRAAALQTLYEADTTRHDTDSVLEEQLNSLDLVQAERVFARRLVGGVLANQAEIDKMIETFAPMWPVSQMAVVDRNILRIAVYEIVKSETVPSRVAVNEAVELAKRFGSDSAPRFVNGVLGSVMAARD